MVLDEHFLVYADGNFLIKTNLKDTDTGDTEPQVVELESNICHLHWFAHRGRLFVAITEDNQVHFIGADREFKLTGKVALSPLDSSSCSIVSTRSVESRLYILCSAPQIVEIDNVFLASRLDSETLHERFQSGQVVKVYKFALKNQVHFSDFYPLAQESFLLTGKETMLSWWSAATHPAAFKGATLFPSFLLLKPLIHSEPNKSPTAAKPVLLEQVRFLNETDRELTRILSVVDDKYALIEDALHGRILQIHLQTGMIVRILKGYRNAAVALRDNEHWLLWAGNRGSVQEVPQFPLNHSLKTTFKQENIENGSFCGKFLILFNPDTNLLRILTTMTLQSQSQ